MNFAKLEEHHKFNERGTGLGLSICKSLIEMMGGSVHVESVLGEGTIFVVQLKTKCKYTFSDQSKELIPKRSSLRIAKHKLTLTPDNVPP